MELHDTLPFSSLTFFYFMLLAIAIVQLGKTFLRDRVPYKWLVAFVSVAYLGLLFPKPLQFICLVVYLYLAILALRKWYDRDNIVLPMLILSCPIFLMKTFNLIPLTEASEITVKIKDIVQIAGLSYVVFKAIGLYIDERKNSEAISFLSFFNFTAFVPTLLVGPIDRFRRFEKDVQNAYSNLDFKMYSRGWDNVILGLLFKFILATAINRLVLTQLTDDGSVFYHFSYMYSYLLYLFFDFAGYSLLAIGFGNFLGVNVPINFDKPFLAVNPKEFWRKWHKTLGDWLGDYFFKPIFKYLTSKKVFTSIQRQNLALFSTFTLMGFWNGFQGHFILSGMIFGLYSVAHNHYSYRCKKTKTDVVFGNLNPKAVRLLSIFIMFNIVAFAIYVFSGKLI